MKKNKKGKNAGFTILEVVIAIAILSVLSMVSIANFVLFQKTSELNNGVQEFIGIAKLAQSKSLASGLDNQYGVYLDTSTSPNHYVLFRGQSYALREPAFDAVYSLPSKIEFYSINLGGGNEMVFDRLSGATEKTGSISFRVKTDTNQNKTIYISGSGTVSFNAPPNFLDEGRVKDSRHLTFDYGRQIDTATENIILTFDGSVQKQILISQYLSSGEFDWQGDVDVGGQIQTIYIHTYKLNNPNTQFSIFRDRRINNKSLGIMISGDNSGNIASYPADGSNPSFSSIYVSNFEQR